MIIAAAVKKKRKEWNRKWLLFANWWVLWLCSVGGCKKKWSRISSLFRDIVLPCHIGARMLSQIKAIIMSHVELCRGMYQDFCPQLMSMFEIWSSFSAPLYFLSFMNYSQKATESNALCGSIDPPHLKLKFHVIKWDKKWYRFSKKIICLHNRNFLIFILVFTVLTIKVSSVMQKHTFLPTAISTLWLRSLFILFEYFLQKSLSPWVIRVDLVQKGSSFYYAEEVMWTGQSLSSLPVPFMGMFDYWWRPYSYDPVTRHGPKPGCCLHKSSMKYFKLQMIYPHVFFSVSFYGHKDVLSMLSLPHS